MTKRSKVIIVGSVILSMAIIAGIGVTFGYGPGGSWGRGGCGGFRGMGFHGQSHSADVAEFISWKMDRQVKELNLNEQQTQELSKIKEGVKTAIEEAIKERNAFHDMVHGEIAKSQPDVNMLAGFIKERVGEIPGMISQKIDLFLSFYNMLDPNQKAQVIEMFRSRMDSAHKGT